MRLITTTSFCSAAILCSLLLGGCSGDDKEGSVDKTSFAGTWKYTSGTQTANCAGQMDTSMLTGNVTLSEGSTSDLILADQDCSVKLDVSGSKASAASGQSCTVNDTDGTATLTISSYVFTTSDGATGHVSYSGTLALTSGGVSVTCTVSASGDLEKL